VNLAEIQIEVQIDDVFAGRVDPGLLNASVAATLRHQGIIGPAGLTVVVTGDGAVRRLNRTYRGVDAATDVLSFGNEDQDGFVVGAEPSHYLGDVIISFPCAEAQARSAGHPVAAELQLLTVHGVLHLLGHDHADVDEKAVMWSAQVEILCGLGAPVKDPAPEPER